MNLHRIRLVALLGIAIIVIQSIFLSEATKYKTLKKLKKIEKYLLGPKSKRLYPIPIPMPIPVMVKKHPPIYTELSVISHLPYRAASNNYELYTAQTESHGLAKRPSTRAPESDGVGGGRESVSKHQQEGLMLKGINKLASSSILASVINQVYGDPLDMMEKLLSGRKILMSPTSLMSNLNPPTGLIHHQRHKQTELSQFRDNQLEDYDETTGKPRGSPPTWMSEKIPGRTPPGLGSNAEQMHTSPSANLYHHHQHHHRIVQPSPSQLHHQHPSPLAPYMLTHLQQASSNNVPHELHPVVYGDLVQVVPYDHQESQHYQNQADMGRHQLTASEIHLAQSNTLALEAHRQLGLPTQLGLINF